MRASKARSGRRAGQTCHRRYGKHWPSHTRGGSRMRESRPYGSVRGACDETHVPTATLPTGLRPTLEHENGKPLADLGLLAKPPPLAIVPRLLVFFIIAHRPSADPGA